MGLPQVPSIMIPDEVAAAALNAFMQAPTSHAGLSISEHRGSIGIRSKANVEFNDDSEFLKLGISDEIGLQNSKSPHNVFTPVHRIVGFEPKASATQAKMDDEDRSMGALSSTAVHSTNIHKEGKRPLVRKRLFSPLNGMLVRDPFIGDSIDLGENTAARNSKNLTGHSNFGMVQEKKRFNFGDFNYHANHISPKQIISNSPNGNCGVCCKCFTDGPLLEDNAPLSHLHCTLPPADHSIQEAGNKMLPPISMLGSKCNVISPSTSFSPLRPKFLESVMNSDVRNIRIELTF